MLSKSYFCIIALILITGACYAEDAAGRKDNGLPAFPGAEGFGAFSKGGRGGKVIKVTNLKKKGPGSFKAAWEAQGPRIIVFDVSGVIAGSGSKYDKIIARDGNVTVAGQTAPPPGVIFEGQLRLTGTKGGNTSDVTIRFLRTRPNFYAGRKLAGGNDSMRVTGTSNVIFDHVTLSWANDETIDMSGLVNSTFQWSTIEESDIQWEGGDEPHNFALIVGYGANYFTVHHTLFAHHHSRAPLAKRNVVTDFRNNVVYNFGTSSSAPLGNMIGNYLKHGPGAYWGFPRMYHPVSTLTFPGLGYSRDGSRYASANYQTWNAGYVEPGGPRVKSAETPRKTAPVRTHVAEEAYRLVCAHAGVLPYDEITNRTIYEVQTGTGLWGRQDPPGDWRKRMEGKSTHTDSDSDGIPDEWETKHKLDPNSPDDANQTVPQGASPGNRHKGYTWIEYYVNEKADLLVAQALTRARLDKDRLKKPEPPDFLTPRRPIPDLVKEITSQSMARKKTDTRKTFRAIENLRDMGPKAGEAAPELIKAMDTDDVRTATFVAWAIGVIAPHIDEKEAVPALIKALEHPFPVKNSKWQFNPAGFIAWALGSFGSRAKDAVPALAKTLEGKDKWAYQNAAWALAQIGKDAAPATDVLIKALARSSGGAWSVKGDCQFHASTALAKIGASALPGLIQACGSKDAAACRGAARALRLMGDTAADAVPALVKNLKHADRRVKSETLMALATVAPSDKDVVKSISDAMADGDYSVRNNAVKALGMCGRHVPEAAEFLEKAVDDQKKEVQYSAFRSLGMCGKAAVPILAKALESGDPWIRKHAARALGNAGAGDGASEAIAALLKTLKDSDVEVRRETVWSLCLIGKKENKALESIKTCVDDPDYIVRYTAAQALR